MPQDKPISTWYEAYRIIAVLLHGNYKVGRTNPAKDTYDKLITTKFAALNKGRLFRERLSRISEWGLDPIQIFASFNYPKIGIKRIDIINALLEEFNSDKRVSHSTSFEGCPSPIITQIIQYRGWKVQNQIWEMFDAVMKRNIKGLNSKHFAALKEWRGLDIASLTMFLFWIDSDVFIPLDRNTVDFLKEFKLIPQRPRTYREYYHLCTNRLKLSGELESNETVIRNFVKDAYQYSDKKFVENVLSETTVDVISHIGNNTQTKAQLENQLIRNREERANGFQIVALRPGKPPKKTGYTIEQRHLKNLKQGELYQFYQAYQFNPQSDDIIIYDSDKEVDLYSREDLKISISSIVGKNGSGKSTIAELLYLVINKIAFAKKIKSTERIVDEEVFADLFIKLDKLYKISVGSSIEVFEYSLDNHNNKYSISKEKINIEMFDIERFCYTIVVNYSLYALNSNITGNWIYPLFHKNDSYQTPIVLNPLRSEGNIDVNKEEGLAKSRMLSNILEPELIDFETRNVPDLIPNSTPVKLILELDEAKMERKRRSFNHNRINGGQVRKVVNALLGKYQNISTELETEAKEYIYLKVIEIAEKYAKYKKYKNLSTWLRSDANKFKAYIEALLNDTSHITFKLRQALNYLKYGIYKEGDNNILSIAEQIRDIKEISDARTIDLIPPSFFRINLTFEHGGTFNQLSSGEKQQIFSINTIAYHIYNVASVMYEEKTYKYNNINIVFDEVELYFHPEMQRTYISNLLHRIATLPLKNEIHNINLLFITHSPFILSDIPSSNIMRLTVDNKTRKSVSANNNEQTFGANIHDLLANEFFLENGFMGKFAHDKIMDIIKQLETWTEADTNEILKDKLYKSIQLIGEPLVKESLMDLYREKIGLHKSEISVAEIDAEIARLHALKLKM